MLNENSLLETSATEDMAGALPTFPEKRPIRIKNRKHSSSFSHSGTNGLTVNGVPSSDERLTAAFHKVSLGTGLGQQQPCERKNSRKSRNGFNKSGGGMKKCGSKDIWFRHHDEMDDLIMDKGDPEYNSDEEVDHIAFDFEDEEKLTTVMSTANFETVFVNLIMEFFDHVRPDEVLASLRELSMISDTQKGSMAYLALVAAMPHKGTKCDLTSALLTYLVGSRYLTSVHMQQGFLKLLQDLPDVSLDIPRAPEYLGCFIARGIADGILPGNFLISENNNLIAEIADALKTHSPPISAPACQAATKKNLRTYSGDHSLSSGVSSGSDSLGQSLNGSASTGLTPAFELSPQAQEAMCIAEVKLQDATNCVKLNEIWGRHCGLRATRELIKDIQVILAKFMDDQDLSDVDQSIRALESPHFHHEIVYQAILTAIESGTDDGIDKIVQLMKELCESVLVSYDQLCRGVKRVYAEMPLLQTETPLAYSLLNRFIEKSVETGFFPIRLAHECPSKARKRYVSEGDHLHNR